MRTLTHLVALSRPPFHFSPPLLPSSRQMQLPSTKATATLQSPQEEKSKIFKGFVQGPSRKTVRMRSYCFIDRTSPRTRCQKTCSPLFSRERLSVPRGSNQGWSEVCSGILPGEPRFLSQRAPMLNSPTRDIRLTSSSRRKIGDNM